MNKLCLECNNISILAAALLAIYKAQYKNISKFFAYKDLN